MCEYVHMLLKSHRHVIEKNHLFSRFHRFVRIIVTFLLLPVCSKWNNAFPRAINIWRISKYHLLVEVMAMLVIKLILIVDNNNRNVVVSVSYALNLLTINKRFHSLYSSMWRYFVFRKCFILLEFCIIFAKIISMSFPP